MNTNSNNLEPEFDALLKAHLKTHAVTTQCEGFDFDTASAYLEQMLQAKASNLYEEHLAACASCRNQIVELSHLMPASTETILSLVVPPIPAKWQAWFSGWKLGMIAGLGTATAAVLLFMVVVMQRDEKLVATAPLKSETVAPMPSVAENDSIVELKESDKRDSAKAADPAPSVLASASAPAVIAKAAEISEAKKSSPLDEVAAKPNAPPSANGFAVDGASAEAGKDVAQNLPPGQLQNNQWQQRALPTGPSANQNQMQNVELRRAEAPAPKPAARAVADSAAKLEERQAEKIQEKAKKEGVETEKRERDDKADKSAASGVSVGRAAKTAPLKMVAGKSFRFENGRWIDTELKTGMSELRLKRDSDEYKKTLRDSPGLKPYFDLKTVTVVWQGKAYRLE